MQKIYDLVDLVSKSEQLTGNYGRLSILIDLLNIIKDIHRVVGIELKDEQFAATFRIVQLLQSDVPKEPELLEPFLNGDMEVNVILWTRNQDEFFRAKMPDYLKMLESTTVDSNIKAKILLKFSLNSNRYTVGSMRRIVGLIDLNKRD